MKKESQEKYFNFPINLLKGFLEYNHKCLKDIFDYAIVTHAQNLEFGSDIQRINETAEFFGVEIGNKERTLKNGQTLFDGFTIDYPPMTGINMNVFFDYYKNDKSEFDKICLLAFLSLKSIVGSKSYIKTTNAYLWGRMDGKNNAIKEVWELSEQMQKFANEYHTKKIKKALCDNWGMKYYSRFTRGFYVSFILSKKQLMLEAEGRRKSTLEKKERAEEKRLLAEVLIEINNRPP